MNRIIFGVTFLLILEGAAFAGSSTFCYHPGSIFYSSLSGMIYLGCNNNEESIEIITVEPSTGLEVRRFLIDGLPVYCEAVDSGSNLLVLLAEMDGENNTDDGKLSKINAITGQPVYGIEYNFNRYPLTMAVDHQNELVYVTWNPDAGKLGRFSTYDLQLIGGPVSCGELADSIALTNDGTKIYANNIDRKVVYDITPYEYWELKVFNTTNMSALIPIQLNTWPSTLAMGYDNRLYVSHDQPYNEDNTSQSLWVINTITDQIIHQVMLENNTGIWDIQVDPINHKLFGTAVTRDYYNPNLDTYYHQNSSIVVWFDLTDPSYTPSNIMMCSEPLCSLAVASSIGCSHVYAISQESANVCFADVQ